MANKKFELDYEIVDQIVESYLIELVDNFETTLENYENGQWLHQEDVFNIYSKWLPATKALLSYFGHTVPLNKVTKNEH